LRTCVLNELRSRLRKDRRLQIGLPEGFEDTEEALEGLLIRRDLIWQEMHDDADLRLDALRLCMEELSGQRAQAIDLRYTRGLKHHEVADTMQLEATTLTKLLQRTRAALRRCIEARIHKSVS